MKKILLFSLAATLFVLSSCRKDFPRINGKGPTIEQYRDVVGFTGVNLEIDADVVITPSESYSVLIKAQKNIADNIELRQRGEELYIEYKHGVNRHTQVTVYISMPLTKNVTISGSGNIAATYMLVTPSLNANISGSGNITLDVQTSQTIASISGSGDITLSGTSPEATLKISGSGNINAYNLETETSSVSISGSGNAYIWANHALDIQVSGSGDVNYKGTPQVDVQISGSGSVQHI